MPQVARNAKVAQVEDYDSDSKCVVPDSVVQARAQRQPRHPSSSRPSKPSERPHRRGPAPASDSGYSSHASAPLATKAPAPALTVGSMRPGRPAATSSPPKSKPLIHRTDSARSTQRAQTVSTPAPKQSGQCSDPNCSDPNCQTSRTSERRYTLPQKPSQPPPQQSQYQAGLPYQQAPQYQYAALPQIQASTMMPPPPRPRGDSMSRGARPMSIHGYSALSYGAQPGPPLSTSAYYPTYPQAYGQQPLGYLSSTPPTTLPAYPTSPVLPSPTSPTTTYPGFPGYSGFSARQANPAVPGLDVPKAAPLPGLPRSTTYSARARPEDRRTLPAAFPDSGSADDTVSTSEESESSEEEYQQRDSRRRSRNMVVVPQPTRRPSLSKKYHTESALPTRTRSRRESRPQEPLRRAARSDDYVEHPSSSDINDSDRTARAVVDRDRHYRKTPLSSQQSSRRPSIVTTSSSGRTKATSRSSLTDYSGIVLEDKYGRRAGYMSKERQQKLEEKLEAQRTFEDKIAAYQRNVGGGEPYELTADNIRKQQNRKSASHVSGRSQKSGASGSKASRPGGIQIQSGDTVLHVYGDAKIEMRAGEDGGPAQFVIGSSTGRDVAYNGSNSKSSGSRMGRSRMGRRDQPIREENDYDENGYEIGR